MKSELLFTPSGLLDFLTSIEELKDYEIKLIESPYELSIAIGDTTITTPNLIGPAGADADTSLISQLQTQIETLTSTVEALTARVEALENPTP